MHKTIRLTLPLALAATALHTASAQDGVIVYRLGRDTAAIESWSRSGNRFTGQMVSRTGAAVIRTTYEITLANGRPTSAVVRRMQPDGAPLPNQPTEVRFTFTADSVTRATVSRDSTQTRTFAAASAFPALPVFSYGIMELVRAARRDSIPTVGLGGGNVGFIALVPAGGDTLRMRGGVYDMRLLFDRDGRLQVVDGSLTTNKAIGTRATGRVDVAALASSMKPTGVLSPRQAAQVMINQAPVIVSYGSPAVRGRTVWGGTLVPFDSVWRTGANEATHLATAKTMQIGDMTLQPGLYTLWTQHTRTGTWLIVNRQVGQWGTQYNASNDVGRVQMTLADAPAFVEEFTITVRSLGMGRGALDVAWGDKVVTASFTIR